MKLLLSNETKLKKTTPPFNGGIIVSLLATNWSILQISFNLKTPRLGHDVCVLQMLLEEDSFMMLASTQGHKLIKKSVVSSLKLQQTCEHNIDLIHLSMRKQMNLRYQLLANKQMTCTCMDTYEFSKISWQVALHQAAQGMMMPHWEHTGKKENPLIGAPSNLASRGLLQQDQL